MKKTFNDIVTEVFKVTADDIQDNLSSKDIPEWDSMNYLFFIAELEKHFGVVFTMDEVIQAKTLGDIRKIVDTRTITHDI